MSHLPLLGGLDPLRVKWLSVVMAGLYHGGGAYQVNDCGSSGHSFDAARPDTSGSHSCSEHCHLWHIMVSAPPSDPFMVSPGSVLPFSAAISHLARAVAGCALLIMLASRSQLSILTLTIGASACT
jgi:hypothetical protein